MTNKVFNDFMLIFKVNYNLDFQKNEEHAAYCRMIRARLEPLPDEAVRDAFDFVLNNCPWLPKWADFAKALGLAAGAADAKAKSEWRIILAMLNSHADMRDQFFRVNAATERAVLELGGWHRLGLTRIWDLNKMEPAFEAAYKQAAATGLDKKPGRITGERTRDLATGEFRPLKEIAPLAPISALPEPEYLDDKPQERQEPIAIEYAEDLGRLARKANR